MFLFWFSSVLLEIFWRHWFSFTPSLSGKAGKFKSQKNWPVVPPHVWGFDVMLLKSLANTSFGVTKISEKIHWLLIITQLFTLGTEWQLIIRPPQNLIYHFLCDRYKIFMHIIWKPYLLAFKRSTSYFGTFHTSREISIFGKWFPWDFLDQPTKAIK